MESKPSADSKEGEKLINVPTEVSAKAEVQTAQTTDLIEVAAAAQPKGKMDNRLTVLEASIQQLINTLTVNNNRTSDNMDFLLRRQEVMDTQLAASKQFMDSQIATELQLSQAREAEQKRKNDDQARRARSPKLNKDKSDLEQEAKEREQQQQRLASNETASPEDMLKMLHDLGQASGQTSSARDVPNTVQEIYPVYPRTGMAVPSEPDTLEREHDHWFAGGLTGMAALMEDTPLQKGNRVAPPDVPKRLNVDKSVKVRALSAMELFAMGKAEYAKSKEVQRQKLFAAVGSTPVNKQIFRDSTIGDARRSTLMSKANDAATARRLLQEENPNAEGVVRIGKDFSSPIKHQMDAHTLQLYGAECLSHDAVAANVPCIPAKFMDPILKRMVFWRLRNLMSMPELLDQLGLNNLILPTPDMYDKMQYPEWFKHTAISMIPHHTLEWESALGAAMTSLAFRHGFQNGDKLTASDKERMEVLLDEMFLLTSEMMTDFMPQFSVKPTEDGKPQQVCNFPGVVPNKDLGTVGFYNRFFAGPGFGDDTVKAADGSSPPNGHLKATLKKAFALEASRTFKPSKESPVYRQNVAWELGRMQGMWTSFNITRKQLAPFDNAFITGDASLSSAPMLHDVVLTMGAGKLVVVPQHMVQPTKPIAPGLPPEPPNYRQQYARAKEQEQERERLQAKSRGETRWTPDPHKRSFSPGGRPRVIALIADA